MLIRCTQRLLKILGPSGARELSTAPASSSDWYANVLWLGRRKCLLLTHAGTLFSVFEPDLSVRDLLPLHDLAAGLIARELGAVGLPVNTFGDLRREEGRLAKTADRSVLGCMNDMANACEWAVLEAGSLAATDVADLNAFLRRDIFKPRGYRRPIELAAEWTDVGR